MYTRVNVLTFLRQNVNKRLGSCSIAQKHRLNKPQFQATPPFYGGAAYPPPNISQKCISETLPDEHLTANLIHRSSAHRKHCAISGKQIADMCVKHARLYHTLFFLDRNVLCKTVRPTGKTKTRGGFFHPALFPNSQYLYHLPEQPNWIIFENWVLA